MHKEEKILIEQMEKALGRDRVTALHPHELGGSAVDDAAVLVVTMDVGNVEQVIGMAQAANEAAARNPEIKFMFGINGCMDDEREIDQIPAARETLRYLYLRLKPNTFHRFDLEQQALMLVASGLGHRDGANLCVPPWLVRDPNAP